MIMCDVCNKPVDPADMRKKAQLLNRLSPQGLRSVAYTLRQEYIMLPETCHGCLVNAVGLVLGWHGPKITAYLMQPGNSE